MRQDSTGTPPAESEDLPATAYALLSLLTFGDEPVTGYQLKQLADATLRFYWVAPAMSQVYSELTRLTRLGLVARQGRGRGTTYRITDVGRDRLRDWLRATGPGIPVLKHPVALRLMLGGLMDREDVLAMLEQHRRTMRQEREALVEVRESLRGGDGAGEAFRFPALVAGWGLRYFDHEEQAVTEIIEALRAEESGAGA